MAKNILGNEVDESIPIVNTAIGTQQQIIDTTNTSARVPSKTQLIAPRLKRVMIRGKTLITAKHRMRYQTK